MTSGLESLRVRLLGGLVVEGLTDGDLGSRKARLLFKVLALARGAPVTVAVLAEVLWADALPARPGDQVGVLVSRLRRVLGAERLTRSEAGLSLHLDWLDVDELRALSDEAAVALDEGRLAAARAASRAALELARGPLLPDDQGAWLEADRSSSAAAVSRARGTAAAAALRAGDNVGAELSAEAVLAHDPYDEVVLRILMQAQVAAGRPASALASYARARERLAEDLGVSPTAETEAVHAVVLSGAGGGGSRPAGRPAIDLIGRGSRLAALDGHLAAAIDHVQAVLVVGEAGIGKTTLVTAFAERAGRDGVRTLVGRADELGRDLPLQPVLDAVGADAAPVDGGGGVRSGVDVLPDTEVERARWFGSVLGALIAAATPTVLVLDDLHWADAATREWLTWVLRRPGPLLVVATARLGTTVPGAHELRLGPLDAGEIGALIDATVDDPRRAAAVHQRSGGNPLFALALASSPDGELPVSVQEVVAAILSELDPGSADVVRAGAVLDAVQDVDLLAGVLQLPAREVIERLERAAGAGLLVERGAGFAFRHALVREVLDGMVGAARSALLHREAARVLDGRPDRDPLGVAVHARLGGATTLAARAFQQAAAVSFDRTDLDAAETQLRASLHAAETASAHSALARTLMVAGRLDDAADEGERAIVLDGGAEAFEVAGWVEYYRRRYDRARRFADEAVERTTPGNPIHTGALALGGRIRHGTGDTRGAEERLSSALDGTEAVRTLAEVWLGQVRVHQGRPAEALELIEHALIDPQHIAHPFAALHGRFSRVMALGQLGRVDDALVACDDLRAAVERSGPVGARFTAMELNGRSWLLRGVGRLAEADELTLAAIELNGAADGAGPAAERFAEAYWVGCLDLVDGRLARGDLDGAARLVAALDAVDTWTGTMAWHQRHRLGLFRSRVALAAGDEQRAGQLAGEVMADAEARGTARYTALAHVRLALAGGDGDVERIRGSLDVLRCCAALELPGVLDELGRRFGDDGWTGEADERRAALSSGP